MGDAAMSRRITNADVMRSQEAMIERLARIAEQSLAETAAMRSLLSEWITRPQRTATETVELTRAAMGDHATGIKITAASQNGETLEDVTARAAAMFESRAMRYTLPDGNTHAAPLGPDDLEERLRASVEGLRAVPEPETE
jgi:hypothetical protein